MVTGIQMQSTAELEAAKVGYPTGIFPATLIYSYRL